MFKIEEKTKPEVANIIGTLKSSKAKDAYGLDANFLKLHKDSLVHLITYLVNLSFRQTVVLSAWIVAMITPIFKSGDKTDIATYQPISILLVIYNPNPLYLNTK